MKLKTLLSAEILTYLVADPLILFMLTISSGDEGLFQQDIASCKGDTKIYSRNT